MRHLAPLELRERSAIDADIGVCASDQSSAYERLYNLGAVKGSVAFLSHEPPVNQQTVPLVERTDEGSQSGDVQDPDW
jgi:hypothetical protein